MFTQTLAFFRKLTIVISSLALLMIMVCPLVHWLLATVVESNLNTWQRFGVYLWKLRVALLMSRLNDMLIRQGHSFPETSAQDTEHFAIAAFAILSLLTPSLLVRKFGQLVVTLVRNCLLPTKGSFLLFQCARKGRSTMPSRSLPKQLAPLTLLLSILPESKLLKR